MIPKILIQPGIFKKIPKLIKSAGESFAIITDSHLESHGKELLNLMKNAGLKVHLLVLPFGEHTKSLEWIGKLSSRLMDAGLKRDSCLLALGGGVIGDLAGFAASIYLRGISYVSIPTTLISMGDSSIGGKTGIDLPEGKNLLGAFYHPKMIIMDPLLLRSLPDREFRSGLAEIIKHGVIADGSFFEWIEKNARFIENRKLTTLKKLVERSVAIKLRIVKQDERESVKKVGAGTSRMLLNYGHTVGHAIEKLSGFSIPHGEAVSIGMVAENRVAVGKNLLKENAAKRIQSVLKKFHLPVKIPSEFSAESIKKALAADKKNIGGKLYFSLPLRIGKAAVLPL